MTNSKIRTLRWIAPVAMAGVLGFAACGGNDATEDARTEARVVSHGSDTHLFNQAEQIERSAIAKGAAAGGSDFHLYEHLERSAAARASAAAEQAELDAKLEGSAKTHGGSSVSGNNAALAAEAERYVEQLEANAVSSGNRAALAAEAEKYVEQLEANAKSAGSSDDYVPGSRHMPVW